MEMRNDLEITSGEPPKYGVRFLQTFLLFLCMVVAYALRVNMSVAIVAMVDKNSTNPEFQEFDWSPSTQSIILSSFFWGYVIGQIPGSQLAQRFGPKMLLIITVGLCSLLNLLTPIGASYLGWKSLCGLRGIQGLLQSFIFPCTHTMLSKWAPPSERGRLTTFCYAGAQFGTVAMLAISGILASSVMGWPSIFYISGASGIIWTLLWVILGSNSPIEHKTITKVEKDFIEESLGTSTSNTDELKTPWKAIFTSVPFLALTIVHCGHNWGFWTFLTEMPTYMKNVLDLDIKQNALLSALPYLVMWILSFGFSFISDTLMNKKIIGVEASRKLFQSIGHYVPMLMLIALGYVTKENTELAIILLTVAVGINSSSYVGYLVNHLDLAPNYAGTLMGISNFFANIMSIIAPLIAGFIIEDEKDPTQWRIVFFISAGIYFFGNTIFVIFGKAKIQKWNDSATTL